MELLWYYFSSSLKAGCGLKLLRSFVEQGILYFHPTSLLDVDWNVKSHGGKVYDIFFIQLYCWMWIETVEAIWTQLVGLLSSSLIAGCGLKQVCSKAIELGAWLSFNFSVGCGLKCWCSSRFKSKEVLFIQLYCWMWIEIEIWQYLSLTLFIQLHCWMWVETQLQQAK